jgi:antitoxin CptB
MMEPRDTKLKRLHMRSIRRGIKEMDLILTDFATQHLPGLPDDQLVLYDALLSENDHDLYAWITGQSDAPAQYAPFWDQLVAGARGLTRPT